jgi:hypothetical protein
MSIGSPIWLLAFIPWGALALRLRRRRGVATTVPFLELWPARQSVSERRGSRSLDLPTMLILGALALGVLAAAKPGVGWFAKSAGEVSIVLDRGATMAMVSTTPEPDRDGVAALRGVSAETRVRLFPVPGEPIVASGATWPMIAANLPPTAMRVHLDPVISQVLRQSSHSVIVISNQTIKLRDPRIVQIMPGAATQVVAITGMGAMALPHPQVMVRLENHSDRTSALVRVQSGENVVQQEVRLGGRGTSTTQFFDLPEIGPTVLASVAGERGPWSFAQLVRQAGNVRVVADAEVDASFQRMTDIYNHQHAIDENRIAVLAEHPLEGDQAGVWISDTSEADQTPESIQVVAHAVTQHVRSWPSAGTGALPSGFAPLVSDGARVILGVRESAHRQVWINGNLKAWEKSADFVIFFVNALDWIAAEDAEFRSVLPATLGADWHEQRGTLLPSGERPGQWPGIYQSDTGELLAVNAGPFPRIVHQTNHEPVSVYAGGGDANRAVGGLVLIAAMLGMMVAVVLWPRVIS